MYSCGCVVGVQNVIRSRQQCDFLIPSCRHHTQLLGRLSFAAYSVGCRMMLCQLLWVVRIRYVFEDGSKYGLASIEMQLRKYLYCHYHLQTCHVLTTRQPVVYYQNLESIRTKQLLINIILLNQKWIKINVKL